MQTGAFYSVYKTENNDTGGAIMAQAMLTTIKMAEIIQFPSNDTGEILQQKPDTHKTKRRTTMECLYDENEIRAVYSVFKRHIVEANTFAKERNARRNLTMFICAIEIGLRGGDFCSLKWCDIFNPDWTFNLGAEYIPQKTSKFGKHIDLTWGKGFEQAMSAWLAWKNTYIRQQELNDYIFTAQKPHKDRKTGEIREHIDSKAWYKIVETARKEAGIKQKIGTHGLRKTMANQFIKLSEDKSEALLDVSEQFGHSDVRVTRKYACIQKEQIRKVKQRMICFDFDFYDKIEETNNGRDSG